MKRSGFKAMAVFALVATLLVGIVVAGSGREGRGPRGGREIRSDRPDDRTGMERGRFGGHHGPAILGVLRRLDLTDEQKESVKKIIEAAKEKDEAADKTVGEARKALMESVGKGDEAAIRSAATNLGKVIGDQFVLKAQTMTSIKVVLTAEQLQKLEELKTKMKERGEAFREKGDNHCGRGEFEGFGRSEHSRQREGGPRGFGFRDRGSDSEYRDYGRDRRSGWDW